MVDKGNGIVERMLDGIIDFYYEEKNDIREVFEAGYRYTFIKILVWMVIALLAWEITWIIMTPKTVTVVTDTSVGTVTQTYETRASQVGSFFTENNIDFEEGLDIKDVPMTSKIRDGMTINIKKAIEVTVVHDGVTDVVKMQGERCLNAINELGLKLNDYDTIEPALEDKIVDGDTIVIKRITIEYDIKEVKTGYATVYKKDPTMTIGKTKVTQEGVTGDKKKTYLVVCEDGEEISNQLVEEEVIAKAQDKIISYGTKILTGVPSDLKYVEKLTHVRAVSYWFSGNPHGAYGLKCEYGTCAVDKRVIPLGSLIYVEGYGYAIANDVGSGVKGKTVDLYMEKLSQCGIWGARWTTVYIVRRGPG